MRTKSGSRGSDPRQEENEDAGAAAAPNPLPVTQPLGTAAAAPSAGEGIHSDSFHRRIHEDYQQEQHLPSFVPSEEERGGSIGQDWIPTSQQHNSASGWSYSEGDEVNVPETSLSLDAQLSQVEAAADGGDVAAQRHLHALLQQRYGPGGYTIIAKKPTKPTRKPVQERYPALRHQPEHSQMPSVCQPSPPPVPPPATDGDGAERNFLSPSGDVQDNSGQKTVATAAGDVPTPYQTFPGSSAAQRNLTPEEKEAIEGRKKAALARREELERERNSNNNKVARNLNFGGGGIGSGGSGANQPYQQQIQQQHQQPLLPSALQSPAPALTPSQAQRAEENRQRALTIRQNKLMEEAVALAHAVLASQPPSGNSGGGGGGMSPNLTGWKARIEQEVRKVITAQRYTSHETPPSSNTSHLSTPPAAAGDVEGGGGGGGSGSSQLTPAQRQRIEENRQRALQRQRDKIEEGVAAFLHAAMQRAQHERSMSAAASGLPQQRQPHQQQQQQPDDQMFLRFL